MSTLATRAALVGSGGRVHAPEPLAQRRPTVTVVIPCYNYGRYLDACVRSVLDQREVDVDVIIVDDCSTDDSATVAGSIAGRDARVQVVRHVRNQGHITTYNDGLAAATGEYVTLLSADDLLTTGSLDRAAALMERHPSVGFVYGRCQSFVDSTDPGLAERNTLQAWITWAGTDWLRLRCRSGYNVIASPEVVMRTSVLREIGGYRADLPHSGDFEMWMRAATAADVGYLVGPCQAYYRVHSDNMHKRMFSSGNVNGQFIDLEQRSRSFAAVVDPAHGARTPLPALGRTARRTLAGEALDMVNYAYGRGQRDFPTATFEHFAFDLYPGIATAGPGRALARRKRLGAIGPRVHPLWAPRAAALWLEEHGRRWRRERVGI